MTTSRSFDEYCREVEVERRYELNARKSSEVCVKLESEKFLLIFSIFCHHWSHCDLN